MVRTLLVNQGLMKADVVGIRLKAAVISLVYKRVSKRSKHNIIGHNKPYHYLRVFNPVIPTKYFVQSLNPDGYFWYPTSLDIFYPQYRLDFPNPESRASNMGNSGSRKTSWGRSLKAAVISLVYKRVWKHNNVSHNILLVRKLKTGKHKRRYDDVYWKQKVLKFFFSQPFEPEWILLVRLQTTLRIFCFQNTLWLKNLLPSVPVWLFPQ